MPGAGAGLGRGLEPEWAWSPGRAGRGRREGRDPVVGVAWPREGGAGCPLGKGREGRLRGVVVGGSQVDVGGTA